MVSIERRAYAEDPLLAHPTVVNLTAKESCDLPWLRCSSQRTSTNKCGEGRKGAEVQGRGSHLDYYLSWRVI
jgi:hypothetical protein